YSDFRNGTGYVYNSEAQPFQYYNSDGKLLYAYEPVKIPKNDDEKFDSVSYEIVTLPDIRFIAKSGENGSCMWNFFEVEKEVDKLNCVKYYQKSFIACGGINIDGVKSEYFGRRVMSFNEECEGYEKVVYPSRLFVKMSQKQTNNDNPGVFYEGARDVVFFSKHPEYELDYSHGYGDLFIFQYEQGVSVYFPIKLKRK
ncbi:MAG: hypothetical protein K0S55_1270, partial [Clostridia bacterium]|nr:hypothetical protein [Clostridia bacterium]